MNYKQVNYYTIDENSLGQRIDNFLALNLKGMPKAHIYKIIRNGEVRVNKKRIDNTYKLQINDIVRIPPVTLDNSNKINSENINFKYAHKLDIIYEDEAILAIYKPAGMAVHGGSGVSYGVIEYLRSLEKYTNKFLELVHRLDKETSGVLLLAKKRSSLVNLHEQIRNGKCLKKYQAIITGHWANPKQNLRFPLKKIIFNNGERKVYVDEELGQEAHTIIYLLKYGQIHNNVCSFIEAELKTGRTHQIRVHLSHAGYPIIGDEKYGNFALNKQIQSSANKDKNNQFCYRMYLHAYIFGFIHPVTNEYMELRANTPWDISIG